MEWLCKYIWSRRHLLAKYLLARSFKSKFSLMSLAVIYTNKGLLNSSRQLLQLTQDHFKTVQTDGLATSKS